MNILAFEFLSNPTSNDHEARIRIDGEDWLGQEYLGLDPPRLFGQSALKEGGRLLVGRCSCGCEGCSDVFVEVTRQANEVVWSDPRGLRLCFDLADYERTVTAASKDFSWEDTKRTAERLVTGVFKTTELSGGFVFDWASARVREGAITLSFSKDGSQKLLEFPWDGKAPEVALAAATRFFAERAEFGENRSQ